MSGVKVLSPGTQLGPYEILSLLGSGGMGEVYRARDPRLGRDIAIKVLPATFASDADRLRRFEQEARAAAALNHPNIVTVHSVEKVNDVLLLTMEVVEGQPLSLAIPKDGLPVNELLTIAIPLADAVAAAHDKGITHRDLKPANIMIAGGQARRIKVLDFGLAKLTGPPGSRADAATVAPGPDTVEGRIVGTVAYMSPEQAAGKTVDARSDLFSLGVILYEMATGLKPFSGDSPVAIMSSILKDTPTSVSDVNRALPTELGRIIRRCLVKDPARRFQTAADLRNELEDLKQDLDSGPLAAGPASSPLRPSRLPMRAVLIGAASALVIGLVAGYAWWQLNRDATRQPAAAERAFTQITRGPGLEQFPSLSPDGKWIVYDGDQAGNADIYLQGVGGQNGDQSHGRFAGWRHAASVFSRRRAHRLPVGTARRRHLRHGPHRRVGSPNHRQRVYACLVAGWPAARVCHRRPERFQSDPKSTLDRDVGIRRKKPR